MMEEALCETVMPCLASFFLWSVFYLQLCIFNSHRSEEWNCRLVTVVHAVLSTTLSYWSAFQTGPWPFDALGEANTPFHILIATMSLGYFLFDLLWCICYKPEGLDMLLHHCISIASMAFMLWTGHSGPELIATIFGSEISNPFLQMRWFLRETGYYETAIAKVNDLIFMVVFICVRLGPGSFLCYDIIFAPKPAIFMKLGGLVLYAVGWIWAFLILRFAMKRFFKLRRKGHNEKDT